jgi:hypothetical protein
VYKTRPILFSAPMIRALLEGRKTQTRRIIKPQPKWADSKFSTTVCSSNRKHAGKHRWVVFKDQWTIDESRSSKPFTCPYGRPGDLLWVRETWAPMGSMSDGAIYANPDKRIFYPATDDYRYERKHPSIHMHRWASRLTLELTTVRAERLQNISDSDALAEGVDRTNTSLRGYAVERYKRLWESINGKDSWEQNPWVWVLEFKVHECNVDDYRREP